MLRLLVIADMHGEVELISKVIEKLSKERFDAVVSPGDFSDMFNVPEGFSQVDIAEIILQKLLSFEKPVFCVPGNHDPYDILELFDEYNVNIHGTIKKIGKFEIMGFGGALTPFNTKFEPTEEEIKANLERLHRKTSGKFILVTHNPPYGTNVDRIEAGKHVGSKAIREFIEKTQPLLSISAHIHESSGTDRVGDTVIFYPGVSYEGYYGLVTIDKDIKCEIKKIM